MMSGLNFYNDMPPLPQNNRPSAPTTGTINSINNSLSSMPGLSPMQAQPMAQIPQATPTQQPIPQPTAQIPQETQIANQQTEQSNGLDPSVVALMKKISTLESGRGGTIDYNAVGDNGASMGAFQWNNGSTPVAQGDTPANWKTAAQKFLGDPNAPMTPANQNYVAYHQISEYKNKGLTPTSIDALWNGARPDPTNPNQYVHISQDRANAFANSLKTPEALPTYGATFPATAEDNLLVGGMKFLGNIPSSVYGMGAGLVDVVAHPIKTLEGIGSAAIGGVENLTGQNEDNPSQYQQTANAVGHALVQRYGSWDAVRNTFENDPAGFITDVLAVGSGGAGLVGKTAEFNRAVSTVSKIATAPIRGVVNKISNFAKAGTDLEAIQAANRIRANLPAGAVTTNPIVRLSEALTQEGMAAPKYAKIVENTANTVQDFAQNIIKMANKTDDLTQIGTDIAKGIKDYETTFKTAYKEAWKPIEQTIGKSQPTSIENTVNLLKQTIDDYSARGLTSDAKFFSGKLEAVLGKTTGEPLTISRLKQIRGDIDDALRPVFRQAGNITADQRDILRVRAAIEQDLQNSIKTLGGEQVLNEYQKVAKVYSAGMNELGLTYIKAIQKAAKNGEFSKIAKLVSSPSIPVEDIPRILNVVGKAGDGVRSSVIQNILEGAKNIEGEFTPQGVLRQMKKYGNDKLTSVLKPEQIQGLKDIGVVNKALGDATKISKGSQTAFIVKTMAETGAVGAAIYNLAIGDIVGAAQKLGAVIGTEAAGYFIASESGQKWLKYMFTHGTDIVAEGAKLGLTKEVTEPTINTNGDIKTTRGNDGVSGGGSSVLSGNGGDNIGVPLEALAKEKGFNIKKARKAGYSDTEIEKALTGETKTAVLDDTTPLPKTLYHGSSNVIKGEIRPSKSGILGEGIYLAPDKETAKSFGQTRNLPIDEQLDGLQKVTDRSINPKLYSTDVSNLKLKNLVDREGLNKALKNKDITELHRQLIEEGYDGITLPKWGETIIFPKSVKKISLNLENNTTPLIQEAKKYKSAEEFVKAQTNAQHGTNADFTEFKKVEPSKGEAIYLSDKGQAKASAIASNGGKLMDVVVDESRVKTFDPRNNNLEINNIVQKAIDKIHGKGKYIYDPEIPVATRNIINKVDDVLQSEVIRQASKLGYNDFRFYEPSTREYSRAITDNSLIKTKSQLTDIWNKANKLNGDIGTK